MNTDRLFPTSKRNVCPICSDISGKCRTKDNEEQAVLCAGSGFARKFDREGLYICTSHTAKGHTPHIWVLAKEGFDQWDDDRKNAYFKEKAKRSEATEKARIEAIAREMPMLDRNEWGIKVLAELKLLDKHHEQLTTARNLPTETIKRIGFRSVKQFQKLSFKCPDNYPGYNPEKQSLICQEGMIAPIRQEGLIVGFENRLDNPGKDENGKIGGRYRVVSSQTYTSIHLMGEVPLGAYHSKEIDQSKGIWVVEGKAWKPQIANELFDIPVLAGARYWHQSPNHAAKLLPKFREIYGNKIVLALDAGDIINKDGVFEKWEDEYKFFQSQGFDVCFAWWDQVDKECCDIDELEDLASIKYLSLEEFKKIGEDVKNPQTTNNEWEETVLQVHKKLNTLTHKPDYVCDVNQKYLPENLVEVIPHKGIVLIKAPKGSGKSVTIKRIKNRLCGGYWEEKVKTSPQISLFGEVKPELERIYHKKTGVKFISITARIALGRAQAIEWEITWIEDGEITDESENFNYEGELIQTQTFLETADGIGLCWDSLSRLFDRDWSNSIVVIDEIELGLSHVAASNTCKDKRSKILVTLESKLKECLNGNGLVIGADADLTDISYDYLTAIVPGYKPFIVEKQYNRPDADKWDICFYNGKRDYILSQIENWLSDENCEPIAVALDNQTEAEALSNHLIKKYPYLAASKQGLIRLDSKVTQTDFGKDFVKFANKKINEYQPKCLIYTPSLGVGCSLDTPYFKYVFGLFFGNLEPSQCRQMLARVRQPVPRIIWCADRGKVSGSDDCTAFLPDEIKRQMFKYNDTTIQVIDIALHLAKEQVESNDDIDILSKLTEQLQKMMGKNGSWNNPHIDLFCNLKARRNFALSQLAVQLRQELIDEGHILRDYACEEKTSAGDSIREAKTEIKINRSIMTARAEDISLDKAKEINRKPNPTGEEQYQANKAFLKDELPEIELNADFLYKAVYKDNRRWLNAVKLFWMTQNVDATKEADRKHWKYKLKQFCDGVSYLPDVKTYSGKVEVINRIKIFEVIPLGDFDTEYCNESVHLQNWFQKLVLPNRKLLKNAFNIRVHKNTQIIKFINQILTKVGVKLRRERKQDDIVYYKLDAELVLDTDRLNVLKSLDLKRELQLQAELAAASQRSAETLEQVHFTPQIQPVETQVFDWVKISADNIKLALESNSWELVRDVFRDVEDRGIDKKAVWQQLTPEEQHQLKNLEPQTEEGRLCKQLLDADKTKDNVRLSQILGSIQQFCAVAADEAVSLIYSLMPRHLIEMLS